MLNGLNEAQQQAVITTEGPVLVLAGPGSGKTRVLTHRIAYIISELGIPPYHIMAATFTNKAAGEMRDRVVRMGHSITGIRLGTFHSLCAQILRDEAEHIPYDRYFTIYDSSDQFALIKQVIKGLRLDIKQHKPGPLLGKVSSAKNELTDPDDLPVDNYGDQILIRVYREYQKQLQANNAMDFDDLLKQTVHLFKDNPEVLSRYTGRFQHLMVDEFQDTNMAQYELVHLLAGERQNVFVVGDPDQSIYKFRGADYRNLKRFMNDFPHHTLITLDENYRSHQLILDAAMGVIRHNVDHIKRDLFSQRRKGPRIEIKETYNAQEEGRYLASKIRLLMQEEGYTYRDFAVMYRTNAQSRILEESMRMNDIPYQLVGSVRFYERKEIKDLLAFLQIIHNPNDWGRMERVLSGPISGIGRKSIADFRRQMEETGKGAWDTLQDIQAGRAKYIGGRAAHRFSEFAEQLQRWIDIAQDEEDYPIIELLDTILRQTNYIDYLSRQEKDPNIFQGRQDNIEELRNELMDYEGNSLADYLERVALISDLDQTDPDENSVTLMTLHAAKGLEFPVVFIIGVENKILPHERSMDTPEDMAEERRLMYVGITRAKDRLYLSYAQTRRIYGDSIFNRPSPFLADIPPEIVQFDVVESMNTWHRPRQRRTPSTPRRVSRWTDVEESTNQPIIQKYFKGDQVYHKTFGSGEVLRSKAHHDIEEVEVRFEDGEIKKLDAGYLIKK